MMIDLASGWFGIVEFPIIDLDEVIGRNDEYIDKSYSRLIQLFNNTCLIIYPLPCKVMFVNRSGFKRYFTPLIKYFYIEPVLTKIKKPQANARVECVHQVILNILVTKDLANKLFDYIYPWGETLSSISWAIRAYYHLTIQATPGQYVFGRDMIFNLASAGDWRVITSRK